MDAPESAPAVDPAESEPEAPSVPAGDEPSPDTTEETSPAPTPTETETTDASTEPPAQAAAPAAAAPPAPTDKPFSYAVDGTRVDVPGAIETDDGWIAIPRDAWDQHVRPKLANRDTWKRERGELQRQVAEMHPDRNPVVQQAKLLIAEMDKLKAQGPEAIVDWAVGFLQNMPLLEANAKAAAAEARVKHFEDSRTQQQDEQVIEHYRTEIPKSLRAEITEHLKSPELAALGLDANDLYETLWEARHSIFFEAPEDLIEHGLRKGEIGFRRDLIHRLIGKYAAVAQRTKSTVASVAAAKAKNAAAVNGGKQPPPAVSTKESPVNAGKKVKAPANYDEWIASLYE